MNFENLEPVLLIGLEAHLEVGLLKDKLLLLLEDKKNNPEVLPPDVDDQISKLIKEIGSFTPFNFNLIGPTGVGKTHTTIATGTKAAIPVFKQMPGQYPDNGEIKGIPGKIKRNGKMITINATPEFLPQPMVDAEGRYVRRNDGGIMYDYESCKNHISNYEELLVALDGDINQARGCLFFWDEINRIVAPDVFQSIFEIFDKGGKVGSYRFPSGAMNVAACNPETGDYSVSSIFADAAFKSRFVHIFMEHTKETLRSMFKTAGISSRNIRVFEKHPEAYLQKADTWDLGIKGSPRAMFVQETFTGRTRYFKDLDTHVFKELIQGLFGDLEGAEVYRSIVEDKDVIPTTEQLLTNYEEVREMMLSLYENEDQGAINRVMTSFVEDVLDETKHEELGLVVPDGEKMAPCMDNAYRFFVDIPSEYRINIIKKLTNPKNTVPVHRKFSAHKEIKDLIKSDLAAASVNS